MAKGIVKGFSTIRFKGRKTKVLITGKSKGYEAWLTGFPISKVTRVKNRRK